MIYRAELYHVRIVMVNATNHEDIIITVYEAYTVSFVYRYNNIFVICKL